MWVVTIRAFGADEVGEVIGPFKTPEEAHGWVDCYGVANEGDDPVEWYDVHNLTAPSERTAEERLHSFYEGEIKEHGR